MKMKDARAFLTPVDPIADNCSDYLTVIQRPMCLNDVLHRLQNGSYAHAHEFAADVRLTFENAKTYNANKHPVHAAARRLLKTFDDHFAKLQIPRPSPSAAAAKLVNVKGKANLGNRDAGAKGERLKVAEAVAVAQDAGNALSYRRSATRWLCPHHRCVHSNRPASDCGGMLFRCYDCPAAFSDDYLEDGFVPVDTSDAFRPLNYAPPTSAEYIRCVKCAVALANASLVPPGEKPAEEEEESASLTDSASAEEQAEAESVKGTDRSRRGGVGGRHGVVGGIDSDQVSKGQRRGRGRDMAQFQESSSGKEQSDGWADSGWEKDLEEDAKQDHIKRKEELQETINRFRNSLQETLGEEEKSRQDEIERTIQYMKHLGNKVSISKLLNYIFLQILKLMTWQTARLMTHFLLGCLSMRRKRK